MARLRASDVRLNLLVLATWASPIYIAFRPPAVIPKTAGRRALLPRPRKHATALPQNSAAAASSNWHAAISQNPDADAALRELLVDCDMGDIGDRSNANPPPDLAFLFVGQRHVMSFPNLAEDASKLLGNGTQVLALVGGGVVGGGTEVDDGTNSPAMSMLSGSLPDGADVEVFSFNGLDDPPPPAESEYWTRLGCTGGGGGDDSGDGAGDSRVGRNRPPSYVLFADPWAPISDILRGLDGSRLPSSDATLGSPPVVVGGISCPLSVQPTVALNGRALPQGSAVGVRLAGTLGLQAVVAQGSRPIGPTFTVTSLHRIPGGHAILTLDGAPALDRLDAVIRGTSEQEKRLDLMSGNLLCGISPNGSGASAPPRNGERDFLIRQITGFQPNRGAIVVGGEINEGDAFRFHVRDRDAALEDMRLMIQRAKTERLFFAGSARSRSGTPLAALQVSCVARGRPLFGSQSVDLSHVGELLASEDGDDDDRRKPVAGFFANGEIGPVGLAGYSDTSAAFGLGGTHIHGFTCVAAVLCTFGDDEMTAVEESSKDKSSSKENFTAWG